MERRNLTFERANQPSSRERFALPVIAAHVVIEKRNSADCADTIGHRLRARLPTSVRCQGTTLGPLVRRLISLPLTESAPPDNYADRRCAGNFVGANQTSLRERFALPVIATHVVIEKRNSADCADTIGHRLRARLPTSVRCQGTTLRRLDPALISLPLTESAPPDNYADRRFAGNFVGANQASLRVRFALPVIATHVVIEKRNSANCLDTINQKLRADAADTWCHSACVLANTLQNFFRH